MPEEKTATTFGPNAWLVDEMYEQFRQDPSSVSESWQDFFADYRPSGAPNGAREVPPTASAAASAPVAAPQAPSASASSTPTPPASAAPPASSNGDGARPAAPAAPAGEKAAPTPAPEKA